MRNKNVFVDLTELLELDKQKSALLLEIEQLNALKNDINDLIRSAQNDEERREAIEKGKEIKEKIDVKEPMYRDIKIRFDAVLKKVPNMPSDDTPIGKDDSENVVVRTSGKKPSFDFQPKEHWELGADLDCIDSVHAVKVSGSRFAYLKGGFALLEFALIQYAISILTDTKKIAEIITKNKLNVEAQAFVPVVPPVFIKPEVFDRMARLEPKEERYYIPQDDVFLIGSAEHTLGPLHMDEIVGEAQCPLRYLGFSTSFRREAGTYGKDMKGILRLHQFDKLELESFTVSEKALEEQDFFVAIQEYFLQSLALPYRVVMCCTGDMGDPDARHIDMEVWLPGQNAYRETHSADLMTDYQARRLNTRIRRKDGTIEYAHMNDATAFAIGRTIIAIVENYQQKDGSIAIPDVLKPFMPIEKI